MKLLILLLALQAHAEPTAQQREDFIQAIETRHQQYMDKVHSEPHQPIQYYNPTPEPLDLESLSRHNFEPTTPSEIDVFTKDGSYFGTAEPD